MKRFFILLILSCVFVIQAQDDVQSDLDLFGNSLEVTAVIVQQTTGGTFDDMGDGTFILTLEGISPDTTLTRLPGTSAQVDTATFAQDWLDAAQAYAGSQSALIPTQATGELILGDLTVYMTIFTVQFDPANNHIGYTVVIDQVIADMEGEALNLDLMNLSNLDVVDLKPLPEIFSDATLTISGSDLFWQTLQDAAKERLRSLRSAENNTQCLLNEGQLTEARNLLHIANAEITRLLAEEPASDSDAWAAWNDELSATIADRDNIERAINLLTNWLSDNNCQ